MVACFAGLSRFINGSTTRQCFVTKPDYFPRVHVDEDSTSSLLFKGHAFPPPRRQWTDRPARRIGTTLPTSHSGRPRAHLWKPHPRPGLTIVTGSPLSKSDIRSALLAAPHLSPSAAIITLNTVRKSDSPFAAQISPPRFLADSCANACDVLEHAGVRRVIVMSTAGAGDSWGSLPWMSKAFMGLDQHQVRSRGSQPRRQGDPAHEDGLDSCEGREAAIRPSKAGRHEDGSKNAGQQG